jgi:hypothetical protein
LLPFWIWCRTNSNPFGFQLAFPTLRSGSLQNRPRRFIKYFLHSQARSGYTRTLHVGLIKKGSHGCPSRFGADTRTRTANLLITNQLHYQLCYVGNVWYVSTRPSGAQNLFEVHCAYPTLPVSGQLQAMSAWETDCSTRCGQEKPLYSITQPRSACPIPGNSSLNLLSTSGSNICSFDQSSQYSRTGRSTVWTRASKPCFFITS